MREVRFTMAAVLLALASACTHSRVQTTESYVGPIMQQHRPG